MASYCALLPAAAASRAACNRKGTFTDALGRPANLPASMPSYHFSDYELFTGARRLVHAGRDVAVGVRVFDVVAYLVDHRERVVGRDELIAAVWGRVDGADALLAQAILKARRAFGDDGHAQHHIRTVPRFGYQWVAATETIKAAPAISDGATRPGGGVKDILAVVSTADAGTAAPDSVAHGSPVAAATPSRIAVTPARIRRRWPQDRLAALLLLALAAIAVAVVITSTLWGHRGQLAQAPDVTSARAPESAARIVPGLILVVPTQVQSRVADDGWMRLGVMSLIAQALDGLSGHAVVPDATALAAATQARTDVARLRAATGAALVITTDAEHVGDDWTLNAILLRGNGGTQMISAKAADPVIAATALARNLRALLSPAGTFAEQTPLAPEILALTTCMRAAILEGQNGRALAVVARAAPADAMAPEVILLHAEALQQLGHTGEAAVMLQELVGRTITGSPSWWPNASTLLGDGDLAQGNPAAAALHFRHSLDLLGAHGDRRSAGLAWRGLGIAQAMRNDFAGAEASYLHARLELEPIGDRLLLARVTDGLGYIAASQGHMADALLLYQQAATMGSAFGSNETELGSRLNIAATHEYLLQHAVALSQLRALLPRVRQVDYPTLKRFGLAMYANALAETGAISEARQQLTQMDDDRQPHEQSDAVVDVRIDEARVRYAIGDLRGAIAQAEAIRASLTDASRPDLRLEVAALLLRAQLAAGDKVAAGVLAGSTDLWTPGNALPPARAHALAARAQWQAASDDAAAAESYRQAFAQARSSGAPVIVRDVVVSYTQFLLTQGDIDNARVVAGVVSPYSEEDFEVALLLARLAVASHAATVARAYFAQAHGLAGERWTPTLAREETTVIGKAESAASGD